MPKPWANTYRQRRKTVTERFWEKVDKRGPSQCWNWMGCKKGKYGGFRFRGKMVRTHRVAFELCIGPIPPTQNCLHKCDNTMCVNPSHLLLGTQKQNVADMFARKRDNRPKGDRHYLRKAPRFGEANNVAKLTESEVIKIRARLAQKIPQREIAVEFRVHQGTICAINRRKAWSHI